MPDSGLQPYLTAVKPQLTGLQPYLAGLQPYLTGLKFHLTLVCNYAYNTRKYTSLQLAIVIDEVTFLTGFTGAKM